MPHQCTACGHTFPDGSKEMLSGCPDCGGTKFQFRPEGADLDDPDATEDPPEPPERPDSGVAGTVGKAASTVRDLMGGENAPEPRAGTDTDANADADANADPDAHEQPGEPEQPSGTPTAPEPDATEPDVADPDATEDPGDADTADPTSSTGEEDAAQASARSDVVSPDELPDPGERDPPAVADADRPDPEDGTVVSEPTGENPGLDDLREELNDQFESIKIVEPGQYELNLMELYDREEFIIALQEDGKYSIQVPEDMLGGE